MKKMKLKMLQVLLAAALSLPAVTLAEVIAYCEQPFSMVFHQYLVIPDYHYVGDPLILSVDNIPGPSGVANFYYQYGNGPLDFIGSGGNGIIRGVTTNTVGWQNVRANAQGTNCIISTNVFSYPSASISSISGTPVTVSEISFNGSASGGAGGNTFEWVFGDGATSNSMNATHTYNQAGTYQVTFKVTDQNGKSSNIASQSLTITDNPNVPGRPSLILSEFAGCNGNSATYTFDWNPTGAQPSNYYAWELKPPGSGWFPVEWLTNNTRIEYGLAPQQTYSVRVRGCLSNSETTCGPYRQKTFAVNSCGGGGGGHMH